MELTARCEQQASELLELRKRVRELEDQEQARSCSSRGSCIGAKTPGPSSERSAQTDISMSESSDVARSLLPEFSEEMQQTQLAEIHAEVGEKARELRRVQESMRLLQRELAEQRSIADQYRNQVEVLEEQLNSSLMKRRRESAEDIAEQIAVSARGSRPLSARSSRPPSATSGGSRGIFTAAGSSPNAVGMRVSRAWAEAGTSPAASSRSRGWETPRSTRTQSRVMDESSDEDP